MADEHDGIGEGDDLESYSYDYAADGAGAGAAADCLDCGGTGKVQLLFTARPCETCGGTGKADAGQDPSCAFVDGSRPPVPGRWVTEYTFDAQDELIGQRVYFVADARGREAPPAA